MSQEKFVLHRIAAVSGIGVLLFLPGLVIQVSKQWFPEPFLAQLSMESWLDFLAIHPNMSLLGIGLSIVAILCFHRI